MVTLTRLTQKKSSVYMDVWCNQYVWQFNQAFTFTPISLLLDSNRSLIMEVDASNIALGIVLLQIMSLMRRDF